MPKQGQPPQKFEIDAAYLAGMSRRLAYVATRFGEIANKIPENSVIRVTGKPTAEKSQGLLEGWMATLQGGLDKLALSADAVAEGKRRGMKSARDAKTLGSNAKNT